MSRITKRDAAPGGRAPVEHRLAVSLDTPFLARVVPHLPPETLHQLIRHHGLAACAELVTSATPAQLTLLLDVDLWRQAGPERDHRFDADRFGEWIEVLVGAGHSVAARTVAGLDRNLVVAGLSRHVRVLDPGIFEPTAQSDDEPADRHEAMGEGDSIAAADAPAHESSGDGLECEVGGYIVRARRADAWDAIVALLVALDAEHGNDFHALMQGCRRLSNSRSEIDGLDGLLPPPEQYLHEVAIERERRQARQGYATPADARAFLEMARQPKHTQSGAPVTGSREANPIVTAYFRAANQLPESPDQTTGSSKGKLESPALPSAAPHANDVDAHATAVPESLEAVMELLTDVLPDRPRALLEAADADPKAAGLTRLRRLMAHVRETHATAYFTRSRELAFLANTLLAGCSVQSRPFTPHEASDAAAAICNLGLEYWPARWPSAASPDASPPHRHDMGPADSLLVDLDLVTAFEVGWSVLHQDVSLFAVEQLLATLADIDSVDPDIRRGLAALRRALELQRDAGTPWRARDAAEVLATIDMTAWISVLGLLDECPILPAALTAVLEGCTTPVSATAFEFISTPARIDDVRRFMRKLPGLLAD